MKVTMGTLVVGSNLMRMKSDFTLLVFVTLNSNISFKLRNGLHKFLNGSNLYPHRVMGTSDVKEYSRDSEAWCKDRATFWYG